MAEVCGAQAFPWASHDGIMKSLYVDLVVPGDRRKIGECPDPMGESIRRLTTLLVAFMIAMAGLFATTAAPASADYPDPPAGWHASQRLQ
ncbi:hypothetical protein [Micromonospora sp. LOL_021]|uniref:hypothetical protein n=1 Tax=Micromonospora sp. LOL_021 TaxID=3345417 RepID=UPI003A843F56